MRWNPLPVKRRRFASLFPGRYFRSAMSQTSAIAEKTPPRAGVLRRAWRVAWRIALLLVLLPLVLVPVYKVVPPVSTLMVGSFLVGAGAERTYVPLSEISPSLVAAVLMAEDGKYCEHGGVDWAELGKVIDNGRPGGASTIAMQTVKNLFLWPQRSYVRKALEIPLAAYADLVWGKEREMEIYLNVVEWGPGIFGAEAAARHYFDRPASRLTARQAALLAAALPNPAARNPGAPGRALETVARRVAARARAAGAYIGCLGG